MKEKRKQNRHHHHHKRSNRPASAQQISSSSKKSKRTEGHSPSSLSEKEAHKMDTSPPPKPSLLSVDGQSNKSGRSSTSSEPLTSLKLCNSVNSNKKAEQSRAHSSSGARGSVSRDDGSQTETIIVSRCSNCRSIVSSRSAMQQQARTESKPSTEEASSRATSVQSRSTRDSSVSASERRSALEKRAELIANAVRKDLHQ